MAFIGEAPATNEVRTGEPFVGASGQLLNAVLGNYGINRNNLLLTNACSCSYPKSMKELPPAAIEACRPRLIVELSAANVDTAVVMGNSAVKALLPPGEARKGITKLRAGPPRTTNTFEPPLLQDRPEGFCYKLTVVPTFHPAACLRNQASFPLMVSDVGKAIATDKPTKWYEPTIVVIKDTPTAHTYIDQLTALNRGYGLVVDTESGRDKDTSYGRDDGPYGRILCIGIGGLSQTDQDTVYVFSDEVLKSASVRNRMRYMLNECGSIMQNGKYDIGVLMTFLEQDEPFPLLFDTMLSSYTLNEFGGVHGLKYMGQELLGTPEWEAEIKPHITKDQGYGSIPQPLLHKYNAFDVHVTRMLYSYLSALVEEQGLTKLNNFLLRISTMLTYVESRGMGFDLTTSKDIERELDIELDQRRDLIPINPNSWQQIKKYLQDFGIETESTDEDHLNAIISNPRTPEVVREMLGLILEYRKHRKMKGTYVTGLQEKLSSRGTIHPSFLIHGTNTGRLSSRSPNSQNIPRVGRIKQQFIPSDSRRVMIQLDYSQAELRTLVWLAKEPGLRDLFNDPTRDVFVELCRSMFPAFETLSDVERKELRTLIKTFAYGISYGRTAAGIAADPDFKMTVSEAEIHMNKFKSMIPNIMRFQQEEVIDRIHQGHDLVNPFGRHKRFHLITDFNQQNIHNEAMAYLPQSTASDMCLEAACRLTQDRDEPLHIVNLIHDAILLEALPDEAEEVARLADSVMCKVAAEITGGYVDFATDYSVGRSWYDVK